MARTTGSDDLFCLIHSLTTEEKGYFKKFSLRHTSKGNNYLLLFDTISRQKEFEEQSLKKRFKAYAAMKVYLFEMIMQSLMIYWKELDIQTELLRKMIYSSILQKKGLKKKASKLNREALNTAARYEIFWLQEQFFRNDVVYTSDIWKGLDLFKKYQAASEYLKTLRAKQDNRDEYTFAANYILNYDEVKTISGNSLPPLDSHLNINRLSDKNAVLSISNNRARLFALASYHNVKKDFKESDLVFRELFEYEEELAEKKHPLYSLVYYRIALRSFIMSTLLARNYPAIPALLKRQYALIEKDDQSRSNAFYLYCLRSFDYFWRTGKHKEAKDFFIKNSSEMADYNSHTLNPLLPLYIQTRKIVLEYSLGNFTQVMLGISELHPLCKKNMAPQILIETEWLKVFIHLLTDDYDLTRTVALKLTKQKEVALSNLEKTILVLLRKINPLNRKEILNRALDEYNKMTQPVYILESIDLKSALEHVLTKKPFKEIIRKYFE